ncbi:thiol-activated cytolysin family protein [Bacteroides sp. f07]|uniref:thiol-activated cytolysin family protein n=1 Tax=Bacteroides sp. f07 TaxID=3132704 RepID=UPI0036F41D9B
MKKKNLSKRCFLLLLTTTFFYSCGDSEEIGKEMEKNKNGSFSSEINTYITQLPSVQQIPPFAERKAENNKPVSNTFSLAALESRASANKEFYEQAKEFEEQLLFSDDKSIFYPGALLQAKSVIEGNYTAIITERQPIVISTDLQGKGDPTITIQSPSLSNVRKGINELLERDFNSPAANITYSIEEVYDKNHLKIAMGGNYKGVANTVEASAGFSFDKERNRFLVKVQQIFYELSIDEPKMPSSFFAKEFDYKKELGKDKPLYVSSVKYGRVLLLGIETTMTKREAETKLQASILSGKIGVNAEAAYNDLLKESTIKGRVLGGNAKLGAIASISLENVKKFIEDGAKFDVNNPGAPVAYKLKELGTNKTFKTVIYSKYMKNDPYIGEFSQMSFDLIIPDDLRTLSGKKVETGKGYIQYGDSKEKKNGFQFSVWEENAYVARYNIPSYKSKDKLSIIFTTYINKDGCIFEIPMFESLIRAKEKASSSFKLYDRIKKPLKIRDTTGNFVIDLGIENLKMTN